MIIRCPQCEHTRSINESKIPSTAELATCPKCKHRFRFRTLRHSAEAPAQHDAPPPQRSRPPLPSSAPQIIRPQSAVRESAEQSDIWDAVDALHLRWQAQLDQHVTEVETPGISASPAEPDRHAKTRPDTERVPGQRAGGPAGAPSGAATEQTAEAALDAAPASFTPGKEPGMTSGDSPAAMPRATAAPHAAPGATPSAARPDTQQAPADQTRHPAPHLAPQQAPQQAPHPTGQDGPAPFPPHPDALLARGHEAPDPRQPEAPDTPPPAGQAMPVVFPYAEGGVDPEERVEHDLLMLRQEPPARPMRDLGKLREFPDGEQHDDAPDADTRGVPWENPARYGWVRGFMRTVREAMFDAPAFFSHLDTDGSLAPGYLFFLILGYISIIATVAWSQAAAVFLPGTTALAGAPVALPVLLLLAPIALGLMLLFVTGAIRVVVGLFAPGKAAFPVTYRVVSYSFAPFILSIVPFVGPPAGALWFLASLILGCRHALGLSWGLALTAPFFPAAALLGGLFWYFL